MGLGKAVKIFFTNEVKCDRCGATIIYEPHKDNPEPDKWGFTDRGGMGFFSSVNYGTKENLCKMCKALGKLNAETEKYFNSPEIQEQAALEQENLRLENQLLKQRLQNEAMNTAGNNVNTSPVVNTGNRTVNTSISVSRKSAKFCSSCGSGLKPNAKFCGGCGKQVK